jgi:hypothetical protein
VDDESDDPDDIVRRLRGGEATDAEFAVEARTVVPDAVEGPRREGVGDLERWLEAEEGLMSEKYEDSTLLVVENRSLDGDLTPPLTSRS